MPHPRPPPADADEQRAIAAAIANEKKKPDAPKREGNPVATLLGAVAVLALVCGGVYYALEMLHQNDDVQPILPPPPTGKIAPKVNTGPTPSPGPARVGAGEKAAEDLSQSARQHGGARPAHSEAPSEAKGEATESASGEKGFLAIACKPECEIEIDGRATGKRSPQEGIALSVGSHKLRLVNHQVNLWTTDTINIASGTTTKKFYNLVLMAK